ncbi:MAG: glycosyltransferase family 4 protein [Desulfovibrio sp.]|nr:glycosyltransferase family 4 protein [Desulfovibrio sp.]
MTNSENNPVGSEIKRDEELSAALERIFYERLAERSEEEHENSVLARRMAYEAGRYGASFEKSLSDALKSWTFPFLPPFKFLKYWLNENITFIHPAFGGKNYDKVIDVYDRSGFKGLEDFFKGKFLSPFMIAQAYTALARKFMTEDRRDEARIAAVKAFETEPRDFRAKWSAFRLAEAGDAEAAKDLLLCLDGKVKFSPTEEKTRKNIIAKATLESEAKIYSKICDKILGPAFGGIFDAMEKLKDPDNPGESAAKIVSLIEASSGATPGLKAALALRAALVHAGDEEILCEYALSRCPRAPNLRLAYWLALKRGRFLLASGVIDRYARTHSHLSSDYELDLLEYMLAEPVYQLGGVYDLKTRPREKRSEFVKGRICYILHNSLPYSTGGYATRSAGVAAGLRDAGREVVAITRPGYLRSIRAAYKAEDFDPEGRVIAGTRYVNILNPSRAETSIRNYAELAAAELIKLFRLYKPEVVVAASNHGTALPALMAARKLGIPFIYEVRGLWEITHMSREPGYADSTDFLINKILETEVCKEADYVFALTGGLKNELIERGVPGEKIDIAPNACDPDLFYPAARNASLAASYKIPADIPVIGYIGTFTPYEGLEDLAKACAILKSGGYKFRLLLVGSENASRQQRGPITAEIERIAAAGGFADWLITPGRVPYEEVAGYYSLIDIAPFPRKPWPVCRIVSPMKPLEALSMQKAVIVSSVEALAEMVIPDITGLVFESGNIEDLAEKLAALLANPETRERLGTEGRVYVKKRRSWNRVAAEMKTRVDTVSAAYQA